MEKLHCLIKNRLDTKKLRVQLFGFLTIKGLQALAALAPFCILISQLTQ